jgi:hypothetical protein
VTLLYIDGFAHGNSARYSSGVPSSFGLSVTPRAVGCYYCTGAAAVIRRSVTASAEVFAGVGFKAASLAAGKYILSFWGDAAATQHISVILNAAGLVEVRRGNNAGTLLATGAVVIPANVWTYIEARVTIADSGGIVKVRLNGSTTDEISFTGDTKNAGTNSTIDAVTFSGSSAADWFADWYILNTASGSPNISWRGDIAVRTLVPTGDGTYSQLMGSDLDQLGNWQNVDETPPSGADYNYSSTVGEHDTYALADLPASVTTVYGVQSCTVANKSDAGTGSMKPMIRSGGSNYYGSTYALNTTPTEYMELWEQDPATAAAWAPAAVNAAEAGMEVA